MACISDHLFSMLLSPLNKTKQDIYDNRSVLVVNTARVDLERPMVAMCNRGFTAAATAGLLQILGVDIPIYHVSFSTHRRFLTTPRILLKSH